MRIALTLVLAAMATPAAAQLGPIAPERIVAAAADCAAAVQSGLVQPALLVQRGWAPASLSGAGGEAVQTPIRIYGRSRDDAMIVLAMQGPAARGCTVTARIARPSDVRGVADRLLAAMPNTRFARRGGDYVYVSGRTLTLLRATGTTAAPSVSVTVTVSPQEASK